MTCQWCNGICRHRDFSQKPDFPIVLDPDYVNIKAGEVWTKDFWVCNACLGTGLQAIVLARVLSGEFVPAERNFKKDLTDTTPEP
jgi:hypothetical protein